MYADNKTVTGTIGAASAPQPISPIGEELARLERAIESLTHSCHTFIERCNPVLRSQSPQSADSASGDSLPASPLGTSLRAASVRVEVLTRYVEEHFSRLMI